MSAIKTSFYMLWTWVSKGGEQGLRTSLGSRDQITWLSVKFNKSDCVLCHMLSSHCKPARLQRQNISSAVPRVCLRKQRLMGLRTMWCFCLEVDSDDLECRLSACACLRMCVHAYVLDVSIYVFSHVCVLCFCLSECVPLVLCCGVCVYVCEEGAHVCHTEFTVRSR